MAMTNAYFNAIGTHAKDSLISHIGLVDELDVEITGGSYQRQVPAFTVDADGDLTLNADLTFDIPASTTVGGWRAYSALTAGTDYGGEDLTNEVYAGAGQYVLESSGFAINHNPAA